MKTKLTFLLGLLAAALGLPAFAQGTAITYQGILSGASSTANGSYDFSFQLFDAATGGTSQGGPLTTNGVSVVNGLFTVTMDFGAGPFSGGAPRWLQIGLRTNGAGAFDPITVRQALTATPYAINAGNLSGPLGSGGLSGSYSNAVTLTNPASIFAGNGAGLTNLANVWRLDGNDNPSQDPNQLGVVFDFLGTTDNRPLIFKALNRRALMLLSTPNDASHSDIVNVVGGSAANVALGSVAGATIAGGGASSYGTFTGPANVVTADFGTVGGGLGNSSSGVYATISGGAGNTVEPGAEASTISGGQGNLVRASASMFGVPPASTIGGGFNNTIGGPYTFFFAFPNPNLGNTISGGQGNHILDLAGACVVAGGVDNIVGSNALAATLSGGSQNRIEDNASHSMIGGGTLNTIHAPFSTIGGGQANSVAANALDSTIAGGAFNAATGPFATIPGGDNNVATNLAFAAGHGAKAVHTGSFVWADSQNTDFASTGTNQFLIRASGGVGIGTTAPEAPFHVAEGSAGTVGASANAIAVFERAGNAYLSVLTPTNSESGILFGSPTSSVDGGILFNANSPRGLEFRAGGNSMKMVLTAGGNVGIGVAVPTNRLHVGGGVSATAFVTTSDRNAKENFAVVSPAEVLDKVASLPITKWNFKEMKDGAHMGPMAQDFYAAFGLGGGETTITTVDADGVALAAIQGLNEKVEVGSRKLEEQLQQKETEITELRRELSEIKQLLVKHSVKGN